MKISAPTRPKLGFTLIELLVTISIIGILATAGLAIFSNTSKKARDAKKRVDIDAIAQAYESNYNAVTNAYTPLTNGNFSGGSIPTPPEGGSYGGLISANSSSYQACAPLEGYPGTSCDTPRDTCYCRQSAQGNYLASNPGPGGGTSFPSSCDPYGTLDNGLLDYWKFDEAAAPFTDSVGGLSATLNGAIATASGCISGSCIQNHVGFNGAQRAFNSRFDLASNVSYNVWVKLIDDVANWPYLFGRETHNTYGFRQNNAATGSGARLVMFEYNIHDANPCINASGHYTASGLSYGLPDANWHMITITYDGAYINFYVDAIRRGGPKPFSAGFCTGYDTTTALQFGQRMEGYIDDARIYNRVLLDAAPNNEIANLYNGGAGCF